jgi:hypothetical protein
MKRRHGTVQARVRRDGSVDGSMRFSFSSCQAFRTVRGVLRSAALLVLADLRVGAAAFLDDHARGPVASVYALGHVLAQRELWYTQACD